MWGLKYLFMIYERDIITSGVKPKGGNGLGYTSRVIAFIMVLKMDSGKAHKLDIRKNELDNHPSQKRMPLRTFIPIHCTLLPIFRILLGLANDLASKI